MFDQLRLLFRDFLLDQGVPLVGVRLVGLVAMRTGSDHLNLTPCGGLPVHCVRVKYGLDITPAPKLPAPWASVLGFCILF